MTSKKEEETQNAKSEKETWRKPLRVPPRANAMRSFYQGAENDTPVQTTEQVAELEVSAENENIPQKKTAQPKAKSSIRQPAASETDATEKPEIKVRVETPPKTAGKLTEEELTLLIGFEIEDLFDIHELLRGKSFEIYQTLIQSSDEKGRCKITQPELMRRTGIKNRRTFYKHEEWLINLKLLEKRHLPGDHKGVVYRIFELREALPLTGEKLEQFTGELKV